MAKVELERPTRWPPTRPSTPPLTAGPWTSLLVKLTTVPEGFNAHPKLVRWLEQRAGALERNAVDWALGEALAFGSLLQEGRTIRFSGQDSRRGTFSQRHSVLVDQSTGELYSPLANLGEGQGKFFIYDSLLSEFAAMGFEYGYSGGQPRGPGPVGGPVRRLRQRRPDHRRPVHLGRRGQVGPALQPGPAAPPRFEGQGPWSTPAPALSGSWTWPPRTTCRSSTLDPGPVLPPAAPPGPAGQPQAAGGDDPAVAMAAGGLLHGRAACSRFAEVLPDPGQLSLERVTRVLLCSGKVYYELAKRRADGDLDQVALIRVEQLYPFPAEALRAQLDVYPNAERVLWVQEEPENMGAWWYARAQGRGGARGAAGARPAGAEGAALAAGSPTLHAQEGGGYPTAPFAGL